MFEDIGAERHKTYSHTDVGFKGHDGDGAGCDLENKLDTVDKSTIFRTITLFVSHHLAHSVDDGTGSLKYAVCDSECTCAVKDLHTHFYCEYCHKTFCLENIHVPVVDLPEGFAVRSINYVLKGCCAECAVELKKDH